ncbi:MAG: glycerate kinase [Clostridia bacterium]|nr:glycerate kinase [Clostridia bacterium]
MRNSILGTHAEQIYSAAIRACLPDEAVAKALKSLPLVRGRLLLVAIGKAAWKMANAATNLLGDRINGGIVITKYAHSEMNLPGIEFFEAGHPVPDENTLRATTRVLRLTEHLTADDLVLFLVSGGGSALFESVDCSLAELSELTAQLLSSGASIEEINTVRKHLSNVKGGRFAAHCAPAHVFTVMLSDVLGDRIDVIASGPSVADASTVADTAAIVRKYGLHLSAQMSRLLERETPKLVENASYFVSGSVRELCRYAAEEAERLGYHTTVLTDCLSCEAAEAGRFLSAIAQTHRDSARTIAFVAGGETVVHLKGNGKGGRNQELVLAAAEGIAGLQNCCIFSVGSDGTDGPTDAAGGYADGDTISLLREKGIEVSQMLANNDAYRALAASDGLIVTGPTGTNVNDLAVLLIHSK